MFMTEVLKCCSILEDRVATIYSQFAGSLNDDKEVESYFLGLAEEEKVSRICCCRSFFPFARFPFSPDPRASYDNISLNVPAFIRSRKQRKQSLSVIRPTRQPSVSVTGKQPNFMLNILSTASEIPASMSTVVTPAVITSLTLILPSHSWAFVLVKPSTEEMAAL